MSYAPDSLTNNEIGFKTECFDHRLQLNGSAYRMDWNDVQFALFDPTSLGNTTFVVNGPNYRINGVELQFVAQGHRRADGAGIEFLEQPESDLGALPDQQQPGISDARPVHHRGQRDSLTRTRSVRSAPDRPSRRRWSSTCGRATTGRSTTTRRS